MLGAPDPVLGRGRGAVRGASHALRARASSGGTDRGGTGARWAAPSRSSRSPAPGPREPADLHGPPRRPEAPAGDPPRGQGERPTWSPDGRIAFMFNFGIALVRPDGSGFRMITPDQRETPAPRPTTGRTGPGATTPRCSWPPSGRWPPSWPDPEEPLRGRGTGDRPHLRRRPHPTYTPQVLEVLAAHGVRAAFFMVGANGGGQRRTIPAAGGPGGRGGSRHRRAHLEPRGPPGPHRRPVRRGGGPNGPPPGHPPLPRPGDSLRAASLRRLRLRRGLPAGGPGGVTTLMWSIDPGPGRGRPPSPPGRWGASGPGGSWFLHDGGGDRSQTVAALPRSSGGSGPGGTGSCPSACGEGAHRPSGGGRSCLPRPSRSPGRAW